MAKQGEIEYLQHLREEEVHHAVGKPFTDLNCGGYLAEMGCIMSLLPAPPARLLDVGCGTGWTSVLFAKRGYEVTGVDISDDMIFHANANRFREKLENLEFAVCDYESMPFDKEFDCAVFYDSLHHAVDEAAALRAVYRALKPGGVCITSEPGTGHANSRDAQEAVRKFGVTERDMPPHRIMRVAKQIGFHSFVIYPHATHLHRFNYYSARGKTLAGRLSRKIPLVRRLWCLMGVLGILLLLKHRGLVYMVK